MLSVSKDYIRDLVAARPRTETALRDVKRHLASRYVTTIMANSVILRDYRRYFKRYDRELLRLLRKRNIRTLSGIAPVTVLTKPYFCPGRCVYCPTEARMPKSYIASEPAAQRAARLRFDPYEQVFQRIRTLEANGHNADKIELIVLGGSWSYYDRRYQRWFIQRCFEAANGSQRSTDYSLRRAQKKNEKAKHRIIGLSLETRPDYLTPEELWHMRKLGCTHVQIGIQSIHQSVLDLVKRDDTLANMARATALLRDFGYKITYHLMPGLPGSTPAKDLIVFKKIFFDSRWQPDMLKIYPTVVTKSAQLYQWYKQGKYKPYSEKVLTNLLVKIKKIIPPYVRINRLIRDIPGPDIVAGNLATNLRQILHNQGVECKCIRCREARQAKVKPGDIKLIKRQYKAGEGREIFLSYESRDKKKLFAFVRLRLPDKGKRQDSRLRVIRFFDKKEITFSGNWLAFDTDTALIRELHTYGELMPVGGKKKAIQHIGLGKELMRMAEFLARKQGYKKIAVISGVGVREYYRKLGYRLRETYMLKRL